MMPDEIKLKLKAMYERVYGRHRRDEDQTVIDKLVQDKLESIEARYNANRQEVTDAASNPA